MTRTPTAIYLTGAALIAAQHATAWWLPLIVLGVAAVFASWATPA